MTPRTGAALAVLLGAVLSAPAQRSISADAYLDKAHGMWMGQILGNYAGKPTEGHIVRGGEYLDIPWDTILSTTAWVGDDDTYVEYMYLDLLTAQPQPTSADIRQAWTDNIVIGGVFFANRQARWLMDPPPDGKSLLPPQTGSIHHNHYSYAIDSQIATESLGSLMPGMRQNAADFCGTFARVTNDGYSVHAAQYYAATYAAAAFESNVETLVQQGLEVVPTVSRTREVIQAVIDCYNDDKLAMNLGDPNAWRQTQMMLYDEYGSGSSIGGRYRGWVESTVNVGLTTMAVLYGQGDFKRTVEIGVQAGYDGDCNPATAGGLIGMIQGYQGPDGDAGILAELPALPNDNYYVWSLQAIGNTKVSLVAEAFRTALEAHLPAVGGWIDGEGADRTYFVPDDDVPSPGPPPETPQPKGLVGRMLDAGGSVTVSASIESHDSEHDRKNLEGIIDGITDVSCNGHLPYYTYDGQVSQPAGGDFYQLTFPRPVTFQSLVFYEGDILRGGTNDNPRVAEPKGGYFLNVTVEALVEGGYVEVSNLQMSEPLDANTYFQVIELTFDPVASDTIRIRGEAGGTYEFTSIVELEAYGALGVPGDADEDGDVDRGDLLTWREHFGSQAAQWPDGDFNFDGIVDFLDYLAMKRNLGSVYGDVGGLPEPSSFALLCAVAGFLPNRRRRRQTALGPGRKSV